MNSAIRAASLILLTALMTGCWHRHRATPPADAMAPAVPLWEVANNVPPPYIPMAPLPDVALGPQIRESKPEPRKPVRHIRPRHVTIQASPEEPAPKPQPTPEQIANGVP